MLEMLTLTQGVYVLLAAAALVYTVIGVIALEAIWFRNRRRSGVPHRIRKGPVWLNATTIFTNWVPLTLLSSFSLIELMKGGLT